MKGSELEPIALPPLDDTTIEGIVQKIVDAFHPLRIILFGSRARGDQRADSDLDLFVEMETADPPVERRVKIRRLFRPSLCGMDILVYTPEEVAARRNSLASLVPVIEKEGRVLYEQRH
jgi:predicted nucleotidyltransferase